MGTILFIANNVLTCMASLFFADLFMRDRGPRRRILAALAGFPIVILMILLFLGSVGLLTSSGLTITSAIVAVIALLAWLLGRKSDMAYSGQADSTPMRTDDNTVILMISIGITIGMLMVALAICLRGFRPSIDDLLYHATAPAHWLAAGKLCIAPHNYHAHYPLNAELFSLWFMVPFRADGLVFLAGCYWLVLTVVSAVCLVLSQGARLSVALMCGAVILASRHIQLGAISFSAIDLSSVGSLLAALSFVAPECGGDDKKGGSEYPDAIYAGAMLGTLIGTRTALISLTPIFILWVFFNTDGRKKIGMLCTLCATMVATGSFWYLRNLYLTGNPVFPAAVGPFAGPFGPSEQNVTKLLHRILQDRSDRLQILLVLRGYTDWPFGLFATSAAGYVVALFTCFRRSRSDKSIVASQWILLLCGLALLIQFPFQPFSGADDVLDSRLRVAHRFLLPPYVLGIVLLGIASGRHSLGSRISWAWLVLVFAQSQARLRGTGLAVICFGLVYIVIYRALASWWGSSRTHFILAALCGVGLFFIPPLLWPRYQAFADQRIFDWWSLDFYFGGGWKALETLPEGSRVGWLDTDGRGMYYPLFGRRLHLEPCPIDRDGFVREHFYKRWNRDRTKCKWWETEAQVLHEDFVDHLIEEDIDCFLVTYYGIPPPHQSALMRSPHATLLYADGYSALWALEGTD